MWMTGDETGDEMDKEYHADDRATGQPPSNHTADPGSSPSLRPVPLDPAPQCAGRGKRQLRATFRGGPADPSPFPPALPSRPPDPRAAGRAVPSEGAGTDLPPASPPRPDDPARRGAAVQPGDQPAASPLGPAESAAPGSGGGRVRGRVRGGTGSGAAGKRKQTQAGPALPADIRKLMNHQQATSSPPDGSTPSAYAAVRAALGPSDSERADARRLFREMGEKFNERRKKSKTAAYAGYRHDLMENLDTLIMGGAIDLKEVTTVITNLEQYTKETEQESTETPATILGRWLRMEPGEVRELERGAEESMEEEVDEQVEDSESVDSGNELDSPPDPPDDGDGEAVS